jgi:hypothetical protein
MLGRIMVVHQSTQNGAPCSSHTKTSVTFPIPAQIGSALREQHDLAEPLCENLVGLLERLEIRVRHDAALERQYAAVEEALESLIKLASKKPGEIIPRGSDRR